MGMTDLQIALQQARKYIGFQTTLLENTRKTEGRLRYRIKEMEKQILLLRTMLGGEKDGPIN